MLHNQELCQPRQPRLGFQLREGEYWLTPPPNPRIKQPNKQEEVITETVGSLYIQRSLGHHRPLTLIKRIVIQKRDLNLQLPPMPKDQPQKGLSDSQAIQWLKLAAQRPAIFGRIHLILASLTRGQQQLLSTEHLEKRTLWFLERQTKDLLACSRRT